MTCKYIISFRRKKLVYIYCFATKFLLFTLIHGDYLSMSKLLLITVGFINMLNQFSQDLEYLPDCHLKKNAALFWTTHIIVIIKLSCFPLVMHPHHPHPRKPHFPQTYFFQALLGIYPWEKQTLSLPSGASIPREVMGSSKIINM